MAGLGVPADGCYGVVAAFPDPRQVRAIGYAERDDDLLIRRGILFQRALVVPYGRMQYVDVAVGPVERALGLCEVRLHTAAADATIADPGPARGRGGPPAAKPHRTRRSPAGGTVTGKAMTAWR